VSFAARGTRCYFGTAPWSILMASAGVRHPLPSLSFSWHFTPSTNVIIFPAAPRLWGGWGVSLFRGTHPISFALVFSRGELGTHVSTERVLGASPGASHPRHPKIMGPRFRPQCPTPRSRQHPGNLRGPFAWDPKPQPTGPYA